MVGGDRPSFVFAKGGKETEKIGEKIVSKKSILGIKNISSTPTLTQNEYQQRCSKSIIRFPPLENCRANKVEMDSSRDLIIVISGGVDLHTSRQQRASGLCSSHIFFQ